MMISRFRNRARTEWFLKVRLPHYLRMIRPGDIVVDAGANVGRYSAMFAARGARVHAFEPHPAAFAALSLLTHLWPNITCINKAVSDKDGAALLYFRKQGPALRWSGSASLMPEKDNIDPAQSIRVETVRLANVLRELGAVRFLKMDIEGAEYGVLADLISSGMAGKVEMIAVETHERSAAFHAAHRALIDLIRRKRIRNIRLDWI
jgi:FkbM family methyltransferase